MIAPIFRHVSRSAVASVLIFQSFSLEVSFCCSRVLRLTVSACAIFAQRFQNRLVMVWCFVFSMFI